MSGPDLEELIAAGKAYEALFVPALFREWAPRVVAAAGIEPGQRVLDVACGTGVLARKAAERVGPTGSVAGVDPGPGMLAVATELAPAIDWRQCTAESLPFPDRSFDAVISQFGLMFFTDRVQALREMLRVLVPRGRLAVAVWDKLERSPAYSIEVELLDRLGGKPAGDALRAPFALGDEAELTALFGRAGVERVVIDTYSGTARFPDIRTMVEADLRGWLPVVGVVLDESVIQRILDQSEEALGDYLAADGQAIFDISAHVVTGHRC